MIPRAPHWRWSLVVLVVSTVCSLTACGDMPADTDKVDSATAVTDASTGDASTGDSAGSDTVPTDTMAGDAAGCTQQNTCAAKGLVCDPASGACVACLTNGDCGDGATCTNHQCTLSQSCDGEAPACESLGAVRVCDPISHTWQIIACGGKSVCSGGACLVSKCAPDQLLCEGKTAVKCSSDGLQTTLVSDCAAKGQGCLAGQCVSQVCTPDQATCQGTAIAVCSPDGMEQQVVFDCSIYNAICVAGDCQKLPCAPGTYGCMDKEVVKCSDTGFTTVEDCGAKGQTCENASCVAAVCLAGEVTCTGTVLNYCNGSGSAWLEAVDCAMAGKGGTGMCLNGACVDLPCLPGGIGCQGDTVVQCGATSEVTPIEDCGSKGLLCISGTCQVPVCQPNESVCDGTKVMYCDGGKAWVDGGDCAAFGKGACFQGQCIKAPCPPGGIGCAGLDVVQCDANGGWAVIDPCSEQGKACSGGVCQVPVCAPNTTSCNGSIAMVCSPDGMTWYAEQDCSKQGQFCDQGKCISQLCTAGTTGCFGKSTAVCAADGMAWSETPCGSKVCDAGACTAAKCALPKTYPADAVWLHWIEPKSGTGCDLNGDGKADNTLFKMIGIVLAGGQGPFGGGKPFVMALVAQNYSTAGAAFELQLLPSLTVAGTPVCEPFEKGVQNCSLVPDVSGYQLSSAAATCPAVTGWQDAKVTNGTLQAGGPAATVALPMTAAPTSKSYWLKGARIQATVPSGATMSTLNSGTLCGWLSQTDLDTIVDNLPPSFYAETGMDPAAIKTMLMQNSPADIDSDGNGSPDAYSFGLDFAGDPVTLAPVMP
ncbi:MAG: hypothetical protein HY902_09180 [Deltaproteobacteria bacterium]|nr:hypothetical protein [Deltaproteobacteria bacterium]